MSSLALITGASSGLGEACAKQLAARGTSLILLGRNRSKLAELALELQKQVSVTIYAMDFTHADCLEELAKVFAVHTPDLVINNAGLGYYGETIHEPQKEIAEMIAVNIQVVVTICQLAARKMITTSTQGTILNVSSVAAFLPMPLSSVYAATKSFVNSFTQSLAAELAEQSIKLLTFCPGQFATDFAKRASKGHFTQRAGMTVMPVNQVAHALLRQVRRQQSLVIYDWRFRCLLFVIKWLPRKWLTAHLMRSMRKRFT